MPTVRTSESDPIRIDFVIRPGERGRGSVGLTFAPGKRDVGRGGVWRRDLATDLNALRLAGMDTLVCLLTDAEIALLGISDLFDMAAASGAQVEHFPIGDKGVPTDQAAANAFIDALGARFMRGENLVIHCRGGLGRSGLVAASLLLRLGVLDVAVRAIELVRERRGRGAIEKPAQSEFVESYAQHLYLQRLAPTGARPAKEVRSRRRAAMFGLAVGDALGAPVEFLSAQDIVALHGTVSQMMAGGLWLKGEWTDDTALALATARAYAPTGVFTPSAAADAMVLWASTGPKDIGITTALALHALREGKASWRESGKVVLDARPNAAGNGSLMRAIATGLVRERFDDLLVDESVALSAVTHADVRCLAACAAFNAALSSLVHHDDDPLAALRAARAAAAQISPEVFQLVDHVLCYDPPSYQHQSIGYVLLCLERALIALRDANSFAEGVQNVIMQGGDTDTNGAVAGALLGARFGYRAIPKRWLRELRDAAKVEDALRSIEQFAKAYATANRFPKELRGAARQYIKAAGNTRKVVAVMKVDDRALAGAWRQLLFTVWELDRGVVRYQARANMESRRFAAEGVLESTLRSCAEHTTPDALQGEKRAEWFRCRMIDFWVQELLLRNNKHPSMAVVANLGNIGETKPCSLPEALAAGRAFSHREKFDTLSRSYQVLGQKWEGWTKARYDIARITSENGWYLRESWKACRVLAGTTVLDIQDPRYQELDSEPEYPKDDWYDLFRLRNKTADEDGEP